MSNDRIKELERELALLKSGAPLTPYEQDIEISVCLLAHDCWMTLSQVICSLGSQEVRMDLLTLLDSNTKDPTRVDVPYLEEFLDGASHIGRCKYLGEIPHKPVEQMLAHAHVKFAQEATTKYLFFLDSDVVLMPGTLRKVLAQMEEENPGAIAVPYNLKSDHLEHGAMMIETETARQVGFDGRQYCGCVNLARDLAKVDKKIVKSRDCVAIHRKHCTVLVG